MSSEQATSRKSDRSGFADSVLRDARVKEIAGTLCGHCSDAGCNHFDDHCKAAEREVTWTDV